MAWGSPDEPVLERQQNKHSSPAKPPTTPRKPSPDRSRHRRKRRPEGFVDKVFFMLSMVDFGPPRASSPADQPMKFDFSV
jgi:hypothetical protein